MNTDEFLPLLETVEDCRVVVEVCERGVLDRSGPFPMYRTELGSIQQSSYREAKQRVMAAGLEAPNEGRERKGRREDHFYGALIDIAQEVGHGKAASRRAEMARRYNDRTGLTISEDNNRLKWLEKVSRKTGVN